MSFGMQKPKTAFRCIFPSEDSSGVPREGKGNLKVFPGFSEEIQRRRGRKVPMKGLRVTVGWETILDAIPHAVSVIDRDSRFVYVNRAMARFIGLPPAEILGKPCFDLVHCTPERIAQCPCARMKEGRETAELEIPERGIRVRVTVDPILGEDGALAGAVHIVTDITAVSRAIGEQQELSKRLLSLMNNVPGAVYRGYRDWSVLLMGADVERVTGYSAEEVTCGDTHWLALVHPEDLDRIKEAFRQAVREKRKILREEYRIRHRDGSTRWISDRRQLLYDEAGEFAYVDGLLLDITDRKLAEEQRSVTREKLRALIESSPLPIVALDREGKVILWSSAAERAYGWKEEEVLGRVLPLVPEAERGEFRALLMRVLDGERITGIERRRRRKDGTSVEISVSAAPLYDTDGSVTGIMSVIADMTDRREMEEALLRSEEKFRQSQKMEAVGRLAGGVAHDFNNLLTAIRGYSDLLLQRLEQESPHRREVEEIRRAGDRAASLTQQLLAFSRKQILEPRILELNGVVGDMDRMLRRLIGEDLEFVTVLRPGLWSVRADPGQIEQVIMNLAVNARDAMPQGGTLTIETANVEIDDTFLRRHPEAEAGPHVLLAIGDTGCGMDEETKARLFEPFFTTKAKGKGTGLGLATVYGIVMQSSGFIQVDSEAGKGTVFRIYLPRCEAQPGDRPMPALHGGEIPIGRETILLVEDEEMVRELARTILEENGYNVLIASDGEEALGIVERIEAPIHLLLTDVVMPRMGGVELARSIALRKQELKVLYMTGYADSEVVHQGGIDPGCQILRKPFRVDGLLRKVREVLHG